MAATFVALVAATSAQTASVTRQGGFSTDVYWPLTCAEVCPDPVPPLSNPDAFPLTDAEGLGCGGVLPPLKPSPPPVNPPRRPARVACTNSQSFSPPPSGWPSLPARRKKDLVSFRRAPDPDCGVERRAMHMCRADKRHAPFPRSGGGEVAVFEDGLGRAELDPILLMRGFGHGHGLSSI